MLKDSCLFVLQTDKNKTFKLFYFYRLLIVTFGINKKARYYVSGL